MFASIVLIIALLIASYTDIRWTEVPDWLSYSTIITGIAFAAITSVQTATSTPIINSLLGLFIYSALGLTLFYLGQWGGGDAKLLMGAGALIGFSTAIPSAFLLYPLSIIAMGGAYSLVWTLILGIKHFSVVTRAIRTTYGQRRVVATQIILVVLGIALGLAGYAFSTSIEQVVASLLLGALIPLCMILFIGLKAIERHCFKRDIHPNELLEGDWVLHPVVKNNQVLYTPVKTGILKKDIETLRAAGITKVTIKAGIPFVPAMMLAYLPFFFF